MDEEEAFQAALDANPEDHTTRLVLADWLQERGDPRADGYRALGVLRLRPVTVVMVAGLHQGAAVHVYGSKANDATAKEPYPDSRLPADWFEQTAKGPAGDAWWRRFWSRREAEDAAALGFAKLPQARRAQLLAVKAAKRKANPKKKAPKTRDKRK